MSESRYEYAKNAYEEQFCNSKRIILSNVKTRGADNEYVVSYFDVIKRGWEHFDNAMITCLRLMGKVGVKQIAIAGFDGFKNKYSDSYSDIFLPCLNQSKNWDILNDEIREMFEDYMTTSGNELDVIFITKSIYCDKAN